jgi:hypothetical protein
MKCRHCKRTNTHDKHCPNKPQLCEHCQKSIGNRFEYHSYHGNSCAQRVIRCNFCKKNFLLNLIGDHLIVCEELDKLLFEKYNFKCTEYDKNLSYFITRIFKTSYCNQFYNLLFRADNEALRIKTFYWLSQFPYVVLDDNGNCENYITRYFPKKLLPEMKFIMGKYFTPKFLVMLLDDLDIEWKHTQDYWFKSFPPDQWDLDIIEAGDLIWCFVKDKDRAEKYKKTVLYLLGEKMNVYMAKMILNYYFEI